MTHARTVIALITGPDAATARSEVDRLRQQHDPENLNTVRLDGKEVTVEEAVAAVSTTAFFGSCRVVIIEGLMTRLSKGVSASDEREDADSRGSPGNFDLRRLFSSVIEPNVLILVDPSLGAVPATVKKSAPPFATVLIAEPPRGERLIAWLLNLAQSLGSEMDKRAAVLLAEMKYPRVWREKPANPAFDHPPDLDDLRNEVEKLALAAHPGPIQENHVRLMVSSAGEERLFPFLDAAVTGKLGQALNELVSLQAAGEDPAKLLAQIFQEIELSVLSAAAGGRNPEEVGRTAGLSNPRRMASVARRLARMSVPPQHLLTSAVEIDRLAKRGMLRQSADALYHALTAASTKNEKHRKGGR
jgi:DNA polymerase III delta subunit